MNRGRVTSGTALPAEVASGSFRFETGRIKRDQARIKETERGKKKKGQATGDLLSGLKAFEPLGEGNAVSFRPMCSEVPAALQPASSLRPRIGARVLRRA